MAATSEDYDQLIAPRFSELSACGALDLSERMHDWLTKFIINAVVKKHVPEPDKTYLFNFLRRVDGAFYEHDNGRQQLEMFIANVADSRAYFRSLLHWESRLAQAYQAHELLFTMRRGAD